MYCTTLPTSTIRFSKFFDQNILNIDFIVISTCNLRAPDLECILLDEHNSVALSMMFVLDDVSE